MPENLREIVAALFVAWAHGDRAKGRQLWEAYGVHELLSGDLDFVRREFKAACRRHRAQLAAPPVRGERRPLAVPLSNFREGGIAHRAILTLDANRTALHQRWRQEDEERLWHRLGDAEERLELARHINDHETAAELGRLVEQLKGQLRMVGKGWPADRARDGQGQTAEQQIARNRRLHAKAEAVKAFRDSGEELPELPTNEQRFDRLRDAEYIRSLAYGVQQLGLPLKRGPHEHALAFASAMVRRGRKAGVPVYCAHHDASCVVVEHCQWGDSLTAIEHEMIAHLGFMSARALNLRVDWLKPSTWIIGEPDADIDYGGLLRRKALEDYMTARGE